jgi:hypothetical protein
LGLFYFNVFKSFKIHRALVYTTIITPFTIAFFDDDPAWSTTMDNILYFLYGIDIILTFFSAYSDNEENIIKSKKVI